VFSLFDPLPTVFAEAALIDEVVANFCGVKLVHFEVNAVYV